MSDDRDVAPDDILLKHIFKGVQPQGISILLQTWDKCVFKTQISTDTTCIVRLETNDEAKDDDNFNIIAATQELAAIVVPGLVPQTLQVGTARNEQGRLFDFSVTQAVQGEVLEDVWQHMSVEERESVVEELIGVLRKLHAVRPSDLERLCSHKRKTSVWKQLDQPHMFGGPHTGYFDNGLALLERVIERRKSKKQSCAVFSDAHATTVKSSYEELGSRTLAQTALDEWARDAVLCHNDLTPRNLILRRASTAGRYRLAGLIDWEMAGFYPPSYELSLQDTYLSGGNRQISFYLLLKKQMASIVPRSSSQMLLLQAMELAFETQQKSLLEGTNIPAHIRARFLHNAHLVRDTDPYLGWVRDPNSVTFANFEYSRADAQQLEDSVVEDMIKRRKSKAKP